MAKLNLQRSKSASTKKESSKGGESSKNVMNSSLMQQKSQQQTTIFGEGTIQKQTNTTGLPDNLKSGMESLSGVSLDDVKVHYNSPKPATVQAYAYAQGNDIHLASGQEKHLPHELGHVVQQKQGRVKPTTNVGGVAVNDSKSLESEATQMGNKALQMKAKGVTQLASKQPHAVMQKVSITSKEFKKYVVTGRADKENKAVLSAIDEENATLSEITKKGSDSTEELIKDKKKFQHLVGFFGSSVISAARDKKKRKNSKKPFYDNLREDMWDDVKVLNTIIDIKQNGALPENASLEEVFDSLKVKKNYKAIPFNDGGVLKLAKEYGKKYLTVDTALTAASGIAGVADGQNKTKADNTDDGFAYKEHDKGGLLIANVLPIAYKEFKSIGKTISKFFKKNEKITVKDGVKTIDNMASIAKKAVEVAHKYKDMFSAKTMGHFLPIIDAVHNICDTLIRFETLYTTYKNKKAVIEELEKMDSKHPEYAEASEHYRKENAKKANRDAVKENDEKELFALKADLLNDPTSKKIKKKIAVREKRLGKSHGRESRYKYDVKKYKKDGKTIDEAELKHYNALKAIVEATSKQFKRRSLNFTTSLMNAIASLTKAIAGAGTTFALLLQGGSKALSVGAKGARMGKQYQRDKVARKMAKGKSKGKGLISGNVDTSKSSAAKDAYQKARARDLVEILSSDVITISRKKVYMGALRLDLKKMMSSEISTQQKEKMVLAALKQRD